MQVNNIAKKAVEIMLSTDSASANLGITLKSVTSGHAEMSMTIQSNMVNGHNIAHGGIIFSLADTAFACACNSYNIVNVAASCHINFIRPALLGDKLTAIATEQNRGNRIGVYDVKVLNNSGKLIAVFRGQSMSLDKPIF
ncbi:MAG: hydroxyphenylacetyl-CoA thioesterase PaaI [Robiginitomaculum sp.]